MLRATTACTFSTSELPKVVRACGALCILTWETRLAPQRRALFRHLNFQKCAERGVLWDLEMCFAQKMACTFSTSQLPKIAPEVRCFVHFDLDMCFGPQRRALFRHLKFQKRSECEVLLAFLLTNVPRATSACNCSSLIWPAGSAPAALASLLFDLPEPQIIGKIQ